MLITLSNLQILVFRNVLLVSEIEIFKRDHQRNSCVDPYDFAIHAFVLQRFVQLTFIVDNFCQNEMSSKRWNGI
jgi:hypothetical protein